MDLVFFQYPLLCLCWGVGILSGVLASASSRHSQTLILLSACAGALTVLLGFFYSIPSTELLAMLLCSALAVCAAALNGGKS